MAKKGPRGILKKKGNTGPKPGSTPCPKSLPLRSSLGSSSAVGSDTPQLDLAQANTAEPSIAKAHIPISTSWDALLPELRNKILEQVFHDLINPPFTPCVDKNLVRLSGISYTFWFEVLLPYVTKAHSDVSVDASRSWKEYGDQWVKIREFFDTEHGIWFNELGRDELMAKMKEERKDCLKKSQAELAIRVVLGKMQTLKVQRENLANTG